MKTQTMFAKSRALISTVFLSVLLLVGLLVSLQAMPTAAHVAAVNAAPPGNTLRVALNSEPATIDPARASFLDEIRISTQIFEGLVRLDENHIPQPALANSWSYSSDASVYTFTLREAYFSNGRRVVAADVVNSIMRAISPTLGAEYAAMLDDIQGAAEYRMGNITITVGVHALDLATVRFDLVDTVVPGVFLKKLSLWIASVVPIEEITAGGAEWWRDPAHCVGTGPFKLTEWVSGSHLTLAANPLHHAGPPPLSGIIMRFITDSNVVWEDYLADQLDVFEPTASQLISITGDPILSTELTTSAGTCSTYLIMDNQKAPFNGTTGMKLRQAFNYAIDRTAFITGVGMSDSAIPAKGILPPSTYGYNSALQGLDFNVLSATQRLVESGYTGTPQIVYFRSDTPRNRIRSENIRDQISNNLGVNIVLTTTSTNYHHSIFGWCADFPDPENWLPILFRSGSSLNRTHYNNPALDALTEQAAHTITESERLALYQQAEQLVVSEAAVVPLWYDQRAVLAKPWVSGPMVFDLIWGRRFDNIRIQSTALIDPGVEHIFAADANVSLNFAANTFLQSAVVTYTAVTSSPANFPNHYINTGYAFALTGTYSNGMSLGAFTPITLTIRYTLPKTVHEDTLELYTWNGTTWVAADICGGPWIDTNANTFQAGLCHFSEYALAGQTYRIYLPLVLKM
jgi:oligopeptide transport system substrate-binding protein